MKKAKIAIGFRANRTNVPKKKSEFDLRRIWFGAPERLYRKGQRLYTFIWKVSKTSPAVMRMIKDKIRKMVPEPKKRTVLEIGPGGHPILSQAVFGKVIFLDLSKTIAKQIKKRRKQSDVVIGNIKDLPLNIKVGEGQRLGTVVVNEVLTHLNPAERIEAVKKLADLTDSIMIIDRKQQGIGEMISEGRRAGLKILRTLEGDNSSKAVSIRKEIRIDANPNLTQAKKLQSMQVNFKPIKIFFQRKNWIVTTRNIRKGDFTYTILTAKRK